MKRNEVGIKDNKYQFNIEMIFKVKRNLYHRGPVFLFDNFLLTH